MRCATCGVDLTGTWIVLCGVAECPAGTPPKPWLSIHLPKAEHPRPEKIR